MNHSTIGSAPHSTNPESDQLERPDFLAGYTVGWRHGALDALRAMTDTECATLLRQVSKTKE